MKEMGQIEPWQTSSLEEREKKVEQVTSFMHFGIIIREEMKCEKRCKDSDGETSNH